MPIGFSDITHIPDNDNEIVFIFTMKPELPCASIPDRPVHLSRHFPLTQATGQFLNCTTRFGEKGDESRSLNQFNSFGSEFANPHFLEFLPIDRATNRFIKFSKWLYPNYWQAPDDSWRN
jgi:hypothetical protein